MQRLQLRKHAEDKNKVKWKRYEQRKERSALFENFYDSFEPQIRNGCSPGRRVLHVEPMTHVVRSENDVSIPMEYPSPPQKQLTKRKVLMEISFPPVEQLQFPSEKSHKDEFAVAKIWTENAPKGCFLQKFQLKVSNFPEKKMSQALVLHYFKVHTGLFPESSSRLTRMSVHPLSFPAVLKEQLKKLRITANTFPPIKHQTQAMHHLRKIKVPLKRFPPIIHRFSISPISMPN